MSESIKLSYTKARQIRENYQELRKRLNHPEATNHLATLFGVHRRSIDRVINNEAWVINVSALQRTSP